MPNWRFDGRKCVTKTAEFPSVDPLTIHFPFSLCTNRVKPTVGMLFIRQKWNMSMNCPNIYLNFFFMIQKLFCSPKNCQPLEYSLLSNNVHDYRIVSQGKTTIPNVDDGEEFEMTDVRHRPMFCFPIPP